ncbi:MAG: hypothetical protein HYX21_00730 [Candidatus Yanofskybacteria bacterium]|nr:hypothetical protein [Candidatus Yanofskybacteria bacterium]
MFGKKEIIVETPKNIEKSAETGDQKSLEVSYLQKQIAAFDVYKEMIGSEKGTEDYKRLKEDWIEKRAEITKHEESMPAELLEEYASKYNSSEKKVRQRLAELGNVETNPDQKEPAEKTGEDVLGSKDIWKPLAGKDDPEKMTLPEKKKRLDMVRGAAGPLTVAYWENAVANHQEQEVREEAEEHRDEIADLEAENEELEKQLRSERKREVEVFEEPNDAEISRLERESEDKQEELKEKKQGWGEKFKKGVKKFFDKFKKENKKEDKKTEEAKEEKTSESTDTRTPEEKIVSGEEYLDESGFIHNQKEGKGYKKVSGFLAERAKGFVGGFGWWESHQAEKFRLGTKEAGIDSKAQSQLIEQEEGLLDFDDAWEEAHEIEEKRAREEEVFEKEYGAGEEGARYAAIMWLSNKISQRKKEYNQKVEDKIVTLTLEKLEQKIGGKEWFEAYKAANGGRALTPEKATELEKKVREKIGELRRGQSKKDLVDFIKLSRQSLDKNWWHRYIYTVVDAVFAGFMFKWVVGKYLGGKAVEVAAGKGGAGKALEWGMKDHVWGETKRFLIQKGVDPTDSNILKYAKMVAQPGGYLLKFTRVAAELAKLGF